MLWMFASKTTISTLKMSKKNESMKRIQNKNCFHIGILKLPPSLFLPSLPCEMKTISKKTLIVSNFSTKIIKIDCKNRKKKLCNWCVHPKCIHQISGTCVNQAINYRNSMLGLWINQIQRPSTTHLERRAVKQSS